jgi:hypothetical protein
MATHRRQICLTSITDAPPLRGGGQAISFSRRGRARVLATALGKGTTGAGIASRRRRWWKRFRLDHATARKISSPDGAKRNPGTEVRLRCRSRISLRSIRATTKKKAKKKRRRRNADRRVVHEPHQRMRRALKAQRARLTAFHRGTCGGDRTPPLNSSYALPGTKASSGVTCIWPRPSPAGELPAVRS